MQKHENRYCGPCKITTRHQRNGQGLTCLRCGTHKFRIIRVRQTPSFNFSTNLC